MGGGEEIRQPKKQHYYDHGGWDEFTWGGVVRLCFVFTDSLEVGGYLDAGDGEGWVGEHNTAAELAALLPAKWFAGIVCVAN